MTNGKTVIGTMNSNEINNVTNASMFSAIFGSNAIETGTSGNASTNASAPAGLTNLKKAKVLFDYDAADSTEISVWANQVIILF